jgi:phospholipase/lecithinase/hemolysin
MKMRLRTRNLAFFCLFMFAALSSWAQKPAYTALYVFGDSYCDVGNIFIATGGLFAGPPYYAGRFSNGPIWIDHLAGFLGVTVKPSLQGGTDYATGGAWVTAPQVTSLGTIPSVPQQVALYLSQHGGKADAHALYILEGGGNDIIGTTSGNPNAIAFQIAEGIAGSEVLLRQAGARHFLIPNLINVGILPAAAGNASFAAAATNSVNKWLKALLGLEDHLEGVSIVRSNVFGLMNAIESAPTHFGFTNVTTTCFTGTVVCSDPDHTLFWDAEHVTEFGQSAFAVVAENTLTDQED